MLTGGHHNVFHHISTQLLATWGFVLYQYSYITKKDTAPMALPGPKNRQLPWLRSSSRAPGTCPASWGPHRRRRRTVNLPRPPGARRRSPGERDEDAVQRDANSQELCFMILI